LNEAKIENLHVLVTKENWQHCYKRLKKKQTIEVLQPLFNHIVDTLTSRIDDIKVDNGRAISFYSDGREFLTINITRYNLRIYIHPPARALFDPDEKFQVEKFNFWESSYQKRSGKYRALSVWISEKEYFQAVNDIIDLIPKAVEA